MKKTALLKVVNPFLGAVACLQAVSVVLLNFFSDHIPYGPVRQFHVIAGYGLMALGILHIYLNWSWIQANFLKKKG